MPDSDNILNKIEELSSLSYIKENQESPDENLFLFISYDLVNSTKFKSDNPNMWPIVYNKFYDLLRKENQMNIENINIWKYIGDEILFYKKINNSTELYEIFSKVESIVETIMHGIHNLFKNTKNILFIKSLIWIAPVKHIPAQELTRATQIQVDNLMFHTYQKPDQLLLDFLGPDIDLGFRLSKYAVKNIIVVSAELALLLIRLETPDGFSGKSDLIDKFKIIDFVKLKGIWNERYYPVIWYYKDWNHIGKNFLYDDQFRDDTNIINKAMTNQISITNLESVFTEIDRIKFIDNLKAIIANKKIVSSKEFIQINIPVERLSEVHCVAIVFDDSNNFLIAKRAETKKRFKNLWEFGCGQLKTNMSFESCINDAYKENFNIEINTKILIPVSIYNFSDDDEKRIIPGIIFATKLLNADEIKLSETKHSESKWINIGEFIKYNDNDLVENAKQNVTKALNTIKEFNQ